MNNKRTLTIFKNEPKSVVIANVSEVIQNRSLTNIDLDCFADAPKEVRHVEPYETSPEHQEIPHFVQDDVLLFRCLPLRG